MMAREKAREFSKRAFKTDRDVRRSLRRRTKKVKENSKDAMN